MSTNMAYADAHFWFEDYESQLLREEYNWKIEMERQKAEAEPGSDILAVVGEKQMRERRNSVMTAPPEVRKQVMDEETKKSSMLNSRAAPHVDEEFPLPTIAGVAYIHLNTHESLTRGAVLWNNVRHAYQTGKIRVMVLELGIPKGGGYTPSILKASALNHDRISAEEAKAAATMTALRAMNDFRRSEDGIAIQSRHTDDARNMRPRLTPTKGLVWGTKADSSIYSSPMEA